MFYSAVRGAFKSFLKTFVLPGEAGGTCVNFCWVCAAGLSEPLPHYSLFCGQISIDPILVTFWQMQFSRSQLSHFLFMPLPYIAF